MKKMDQQTKQKTIGGIGPMMLWVAITGAVMIVQTVMDIATSVIQMTHPQQANGTTSHNQSANSYVGKHNNGYLRISPFPMRSSFMMGW